MADLKVSMADLERKIASTLGTPVSEAQAVPVAIAEVAEVKTVKRGEKVFTYQSVDNDSDVIMSIGTGTMEVAKVNPISDTIVTLSGLQSLDYYMEIDEVLNAVDVDAFARTKGRISRGMDKREVYNIANAITSASGSAPTVGHYVQEVDIETGEDLYDAIVKAKHALENRADEFVLWAGVAVKEAIDNYSKQKAGTHNYEVSLKQYLVDNKVKVVKVFGTLKLTSNGSAAEMLDTNKFIMFGINTQNPDGQKKPLVFVRREIDAQLAGLAGLEVDAVQRATLSQYAPKMIDDSGTAEYGFAVHGYESIAVVITNPFLVVRSADLEGKI